MLPRRRRRFQLKQSCKGFQGGGRGCRGGGRRIALAPACRDAALPHRRHRFRAVVFDLDGTLIDSAPDIADALNMTLAELGRPGFTEGAVREMVRAGWMGLLERAAAQRGGMPQQGAAWLHERFRAHYLPRSSRLSSLYPGVTETLRRLHDEGTLAGICTNKRQEASDAAVATLGLGAWVGAVVGGDRGAMKPDPAHIAAVLEELGCAPGEAAMVGDSEADLRAAAGLAMPCVLVRYGYAPGPVEEMGAAATIGAMSELIDLLPEL